LRRQRPIRATVSDVPVGDTPYSVLRSPDKNSHLLGRTVAWARLRRVVGHPASRLLPWFLPCLAVLAGRGRDQTGAQVHERPAQQCCTGV